MKTTEKTKKSTHLNLALSPAGHLYLYVDMETSVLLSEAKLKKLNKCAGKIYSLNCSWQEIKTEAMLFKYRMPMDFTCQ